MMQADRVARIGYDALIAGRPVAIAGATNRLSAFAGRHAPRWLTLPVTRHQMSD